ncbi:MAG: MarR family transcriptional regulator [Butyricicoccus pullicaecorum]|nr:MarR family transcriptional regulator [Butyricicoccus pullicaecorum]MDO4668511.1 MarR family transcriptional regulator [Butyricicoccus pullicaecorum]
MKRTDWLQMLAYQQELHHLARALLSQEKTQTLTASERELLARLYLEPDESTPLALSRHSGMKKEAVSRCLKKLFEKGYIQKEKHPTDERSYMLSITQSGEAELGKNYRAILQPLYDVKRQMGSNFDLMFELIHIANTSTGK